MSSLPPFTAESYSTARAEILTFKRKERETGFRFGRARALSSVCVCLNPAGWSTASRQWRERGGGGNGDGRAHREEQITRPQRLQQRADAEGGELAHGRLDTRVKSEDAGARHVSGISLLFPCLTFYSRCDIYILDSARVL